MSLYPTFDVPSEMTATMGATQQYKQSIAFDYEKGDFVTNTAGQTVKSSKRDAWIQWCIKICQTQKSAYLAYSSSLGVEIEETVHTDQKREEALLEKSITEALMNDQYKRTNSVRNFVFTRQGDGIIVEVDVFGIDGDLIPLKVYL